MSDRFWAYLVTRSHHVPPAGVPGLLEAPLEALIEGDLAVWSLRSTRSRDATSTPSIATTASSSMRRPTS